MRSLPGFEEMMSCVDLHCPSKDYMQELCIVWGRRGIEGIHYGWSRQEKARTCPRQGEYDYCMMQVPMLREAIVKGVQTGRPPHRPRRRGHSERMQQSR